MGGVWVGEQVIRGRQNRGERGGGQQPRPPGLLACSSVALILPGPMPANWLVQIRGAPLGQQRLAPW